MRNFNIVISGMGYVGMSLAALLGQKHQVTAVEINSDVVETINNRKSPIKDEYIDNLYPSRIVVGTDMHNNFLKEKAVIFSDMIACAAYKKILKLSIVSLLTLAALTSCGEQKGDLDSSINNEIDIVSDDKNVESNTSDNIEVNNDEIDKIVNKNIIVSETGNIQGLFSMGMSIDEVVSIVQEEQFEFVTEYNGYSFDLNGIGTLEKDSLNYENNENKYIVVIKGDIKLYFDDNKKLISIIMGHPVEVLKKEDIENYIEKEEYGILYSEEVYTETGLNIYSEVDKITELYGEPKGGVYETDGTDYYIYELSNELYINIIVSGIERDFILMIDYSNKPIINN